MLTLLSPAKTIKMAKNLPDFLKTTEAAFIADSKPIALAAASLDSTELRRLLKLSPKMAQDAYLTWQKFFDADTPCSPALLAYSGIVFKQIAAHKLSEAEWSFAQEHLAFSSFLYGLLRPCDRIQQYRMEGFAKLPEPLATSPFLYWRDKLTDFLLSRVQDQGSCLCMLASEEMKGLFHWEQLAAAVRIVSPNFYVRQLDGSLKQIVVYTKMARGQMAASIIKEQIDKPEDLIDLAPMGFCFDAERSTADDYVYVLDTK